jgi:hypothetical protein
MKLLYQARLAIDAHIIKNHLLSYGIDTQIKGEHLTGGIGELPANVCEVWVIKDEERDRASNLLQAFHQQNKQSPQKPLEYWQCPQCHEIHETCFTQCWQCGLEQAS